MRVFQRGDLGAGVKREFCPDCGTHLCSKPPTMPGAAILKVGTLDDPSAFGGPQMAIYTVDMQSFHQVPEGCATFERMPG